MTDKTFPFNNKNEINSARYYGIGATTQKTAAEARFEGKLKYSGFYRGQHTVQILFREVEGEKREINFFLTDLDKMIPLMDRGYISGTFIPTQRGTRYAWKMEGI